MSAFIRTPQTSPSIRRQYRAEPTALKFPDFCDLVSGFLRLVTVWLHVGRGGVTGSDGP